MGTSCIELRSYISDHGLHGTITFRKNDLEVEIITDLNATLEFPNQVWSWSLVEFPVDYTKIQNRCENLGKKILSFDDSFGYLVLPENGTSEFSTSELSISGDKGLYGKSIFLQEIESKRTICATITMLDKKQEKIAVARFNTPVSGNVYFRWFSTKENHNEMLIMNDLYHVANKENHSRLIPHTEHLWKIYVTDILDSNEDSSDCNILQLVFDPDNAGKGKAIGDIDARLGKIKIATDYNVKKVKNLYRDDTLNLLPSDLAGPQRRLYLVLFERKHEDTFLACAKIRYDHPINAK